MLQQAQFDSKSQPFLFD
jgi:alpha-tubulin suppressor-like RCC1 family protein